MKMTERELTQWIADSWLAGVETIEITQRLKEGGFSSRIIKAVIEWIDGLNELTNQRIAKEPISIR